MTSLPFVSVLLPVRNEAAFIARSVGSVLAQDYPVDRLEVIVVDGLSTDGTRDMVAQLMLQHRHLRMIDNPGRIVATGLNLGIAQSRGDVIVRVDGHCEIASDYVRRAVAHIQNGMDGVGGALVTIGESPRARVIAAAMSSRFGVGNSAFRTVAGRSMLTDTVPFPAYTRQMLERAGPFDEELVRNQDDEYNYRLRKLGARIFLAADVRSTYYSRGALRAMCSQYFQYGYWKVRVLQKHPWQMRARHFAPPLFVASVLAGAAASPWSVAARLALAAVLGTYLLANLTAAVTVHRGHPGSSQPWLLPVTFAGLHASYGLGFLVGLISFWNRWGRAAGSRPASRAPEAIAPHMREELP